MKWNMKKIVEDWAMSRLLDVKEFKPPKDKLNMHSWTAHNYWIQRYGTCPYCLHGSKIVDKNVIEESVKY